MNNNPSSKKTAKRSALTMIVVLTSGFLVFRYHIIRVVFIALLSLFYLSLIVCALIARICEKFENSPLADKLSDMSISYLEFMREKLKAFGKDYSNGLFNFGIVYTAFLLGLVAIAFLSKLEPFKDDKVCYLLYSYTTILSIVLTSHSFESYINSKVFKGRKAHYNADLAKKMIYMGYFVLLIAEAFSSIEQLDPTIQLSIQGQIRHIIVCPAFLTLIAYERAFR